KKKPVAGEIAAKPAKKGLLSGLFDEKTPPVYPADSFEGQRLAARAELSKPGTIAEEGESIGRATDRIISELKSRAPESKDAPAIPTTGNTNLKELFNRAPVDPLSPDTIPAEVETELKKQIAGEQERLTAEGITSGEPPAKKKETAKQVRERLALNAQREAKAQGKEAVNAEYIKSDTELGTAELERKSAYFAALAEYQKNRKGADALSEKLGLKAASEKGMSDDLKALKKEWVLARATRAKNRLESVEARRQGRGGEKRQSRSAEDVMKRFNRRYVLKESVFKAAEEEAAVRAKALGEREGTLVEAAAKGFAENPFVKKYGSKALLGLTTLGVGAGVVGAGFAVFAGTVMAAPMAVILAGGVLSAGLRIRAEMLKDGAQSLKEEAENATGEERENLLARVQRAQQSQEKNQKLASRLTLSGLSGIAAKWFTKDVVQKGTREAITRKDAAGNIGGSIVEDLRSLEAFEKLAKEMDDAYARVQQADVHL
ncbi:MAG: hypothetical protein AAB921_00130, partial [Patescibacteria group bacterium]